jgi:hypothetical protein
MRILLTIGLLLAVLWMPSSLHAQPGKYSAAIILDGIETRSGGSWQYLPTGKLKKGEQVIVHHEDGGWVAILPPAGAVSWVNHRFLGELDVNAQGKQNVLITADNTEVRLGSDKGLPLAVTQVKLPRGTWVEIQGPKVQPQGDSIWYPIAPPEGEYRWLPKEALGPPAPLAPPPVFVKSTTPSTLDAPNGGRTPGSLTSNGSGPSAFAMQDPQWNKAEQAERAGDFATAEKLYSIIYRDLRQKNSDPERLLVCYNRIIKCQDRLRLDPAPVRPTLPQSVVVGAQPAVVLQPPNGSNSGLTGSAWPNTANSAPTKSTGVGNLRRAQFAIDGKQAYAFENAGGQLTYYVTAGNGVSLDPYVNRRVELTGNVQVRGDIRGGEYMVVTQINASK